MLRRGKRIQRRLNSSERALGTMYSSRRLHRHPLFDGSLAMTARPIWTGYLRLSLVSCAIRLYPATSQSERISFHLLNPKTRARVNMRPHDVESDRQLERSELVRGYEISKGQYVIVTD